MAPVLGRRAPESLQITSDRVFTRLAAILATPTGKLSCPRSVQARSSPHSLTECGASLAELQQAGRTKRVLQNYRRWRMMTLPILSTFMVKGRRVRALVPLSQPQEVVIWTLSRANMEKQESLRKHYTEETPTDRRRMQNGQPSNDPAFSM